jgi:hypothetical protein
MDPPPPAWAWVLLDLAQHGKLLMQAYQHTVEVIDYGFSDKVHCDLSLYACFRYLA